MRGGEEAALVMRMAWMKFFVLWRGSVRSLRADSGNIRQEWGGSLLG